MEQGGYDPTTHPPKLILRHPSTKDGYSIVPTDGHPARRESFGFVATIDIEHHAQQAWAAFPLARLSARTSSTVSSMMRCSSSGSEI